MAGGPFPSGILLCPCPESVLQCERVAINLTDVIGLRELELRESHSVSIVTLCCHTFHTNMALHG